jgi:hypothetical protein
MQISCFAYRVILHVAVWLQVTCTHGQELYNIIMTLLVIMKEPDDNYEDDHNNYAIVLAGN